MKSYVCPECGSVTSDEIRAALHDIEHEMQQDHYLCCPYHSERGETACGVEDQCCAICPTAERAA